MSIFQELFYENDTNEEPYSVSSKMAYSDFWYQGVYENG